MKPVKFIKSIALIDAGQSNNGLVKPFDERNPEKGKRNLKVWPETSEQFQIVKGELYLVHPAFLAADKKAGKGKSIFYKKKDENAPPTPSDPAPGPAPDNGPAQDNGGKE